MHQELMAPHPALLTMPCDYQKSNPKSLIPYKHADLEVDNILDEDLAPLCIRTPAGLLLTSKLTHFYQSFHENKDLS